jgi:AcrR family transcriptional regulator
VAALWLWRRYVKSALDKVRETPQSTKARILLAAQEVFAARGFDGASTREIAARAEVNISSLHYHWESKETLYFAVFERIYQQLVEELRDDFVRPDSAETARGLVSRAMGRTFDFFADNPDVPKLLMRRIMESDGIDGPPERNVMGSTWKIFSEWTRDFMGRKLSDRDIGFFMLAVETVLLVVMLDSPHVTTMLSGNVKQSQVRTRLREQMIQLVEQLVGVGAEPRR